MQYRPPMALQTADEKQMGLLLHLSQTRQSSFVPAAGIIAPIVIWQINKDKMPALDAHGKDGYELDHLIGYLLVRERHLDFRFFHGLLPMLGLAIAGIVFPIIGALKANNNGELWEYPLTIKFLK
jgi:uncharacterized Tic20 family protein